MKRDNFWFAFEPNRWLSNEKLALVSLEARGLWIHLLCLLYKANAGGRLVINGKPPTPEQISRMVGQDAKPLLQELEVAGVYEIKDGAIYHQGVAAGLAKMEERSAGYAKRMSHRSPKDEPSMTHRCTIDEPSMHHLLPIDEPSIVYNNNNNNNKKEREGLRPTLGEWLAFAKEIGWRQADAEGAFDYYQSNGWKVGGKAAVKDWRACARNCQRRNLNTKGTEQMKKTIKSGCESPPSYKLAGFATFSEWSKAGCP